MKLYVIKDGITNVASIKDQNGMQISGTKFYALSYDFYSNEGYIEEKAKNSWRLYTQIGQRFGKSRYYNLRTFDNCIQKLTELKGNDEIKICNSSDLEKYRKK